MPVCSKVSAGSWSVSSLALIRSSADCQRAFHPLERELVVPGRSGPFDGRVAAVRPGRRGRPPGRAGDMGIFSNAVRVMMTASQSPVATRATNARRRSRLRSCRRRRAAAGPRVELLPLAGELLEHVVGDDDGGFADQPEAAQLHDPGDHFDGLAGADLVVEPARRLGDDPGDRGDWCALGLKAVSARPGRVSSMPS